ncbi:MAG: S-layer protein, partial [Cetobacterium sp.]
MNKKKIAYRVIIVAVLVLGYFNYFGNEKKIEKKEEVVETTGAIYDTEGYHIEADKQKDFLKTNETTFEKAKAVIDGMILTGDNAFLDAGKNLLLKSNILGK